MGLPLWLEHLLCKVNKHDEVSFTLTEFVRNRQTLEWEWASVAIVACSRCGMPGESAGEHDTLGPPRPLTAPPREEP